MTQAVRGLGLAVTLVLLSSLGVLPRARAQSTAAYVYVQSQGPAGPVYGYSTDTSGQLSAIAGSPFKPGTAIVGGNGTKFFTLGHTLLHSWAVGSNGAIGSQLSSASLFNYAGSSCGGTSAGDDGAVLDHTGKYVYVLLQYGGNWSCSAYQTYAVNSDGSFTFVGDTEENWGDQSGSVNPSAADLPSILGNETFAYADQFAGHTSSPIGFRRASTGELQLMQFSETDPAPPNGSEWTVASPDASPTGNYVVFQLYPNDSNPPQVGVYTVDSSGNISTTNTASNMPTSQLQSPGSTFSPDGRYLVLYANAQNGAGHLGNGIEIYNFNGSAPLTLNTTLLNGTPIDQAAWDASGHLYAMSRSEGKLWVYEVGASSTGLDSVTSIGTPFSMVVVNQASGGGGGTCATPASPGINVCSPGENASVLSPVEINATANVSGGVYRFEVWSGSTKLASVDNGTMNTTVSLAAGTYKLTFDAYNSGKTSHVYATRNITVK